MPTYKDIFNLNLKYIEYLLEKTSLTQGYIRNLNVTGSEIEQEVRHLLRNILPQRFHVTHGYIISAPNKAEEPAVSPQVDVIIVDTMVPHSIFIVDQHSGMEVVPIEAVVGVFEVKRTLNRSSLLGTKKEVGAIKHLRDIYNLVGIRKDDLRTYLTGGILIEPSITGNGYLSNPLIGIIGVDHEENIGQELFARIKNGRIDFGMIDIVFSIHGFLACTGQLLPDGDVAVCPRLYRDEAEEFPLFAVYIHPPRTQIEIVAKAIGFIVGYIAHTGGRIFDLDKYFFNESLMKTS